MYHLTFKGVQSQQNTVDKNNHYINIQTNAIIFTQTKTQPLLLLHKCTHTVHEHYKLIMYKSMFFFQWMKRQDLNKWNEGMGLNEEDNFLQSVAPSDKFFGDFSSAEDFCHHKHSWEVSHISVPKVTSKYPNSQWIEPRCGLVEGVTDSAQLPGYLPDERLPTTPSPPPHAHVMWTWKHMYCRNVGLMLGPVLMFSSCDWTVASPLLQQLNENCLPSLFRRCVTPGGECPCSSFCFSSWWRLPCCGCGILHSGSKLKTCTRT